MGFIQSLCTTFLSYVRQTSCRLAQNKYRHSIHQKYSTFNMATSSEYSHSQMMDLLRTHSTKKYYIEYVGFMSNHISHGLYALDYLCAPLNRAYDFIKWHDEKKLEDAEMHHQREEKGDPKPADVMQLLGARKSYYYIYDHYQNLLQKEYGGSLEDLLAGEFPKLSNGMPGSALHGMIHLGYGYAAKESWFVLEGLAYLHHSNAPLELSKDAPKIETLGLGSLSILDVLNEIRQDEELISYMKEAIKEESIANMITSDFQRKTRVLFSNKGDIMAKYCHKIEFPKNLNAKEFKLKDAPTLAKWLVDCAITVYAIAEKPNDFFLIHGVTCGWALKNVMVLLKNEEDILLATRTFICTLLATYLAQNHPGLQLDLLKHNDGLEHSWQSMIQTAIEQNNIEEEHIYKLIQVCKTMSEADPDSDMDALYKLASYHCVSNPLTFN